MASSPKCVDSLSRYAQKFSPSAGSMYLIYSGLTVLTHCISRRVQHESLTYHGIMTMPWPRLSVILMFCDSWLFMISSECARSDCINHSHHLQVEFLFLDLGLNILNTPAPPQFIFAFCFIRPPNSLSMLSLVCMLSEPVLVPSV